MAVAGDSPAVAAAAVPLVRLTGVSCGYERHIVLTDVSLQVARRHVLALVGPNGAGKTTLLRTLLGLLPARAGRIEHGEGQPPRIGYVPQTDVSEVLFPVTAIEVALMGLTPRLGLIRRAGAAEKGAAQRALERFGVGDLAGRQFRALSGGQRQRVLLARGLVGDPELLVLDEPVRGLDVASSTALVALMVGLARSHGIAIVVATHSLDLVANHADDVALVHRGAVRAGPAAEVMTGAVLSQFHGLPVHVHEVDGQRVVL
ncbi:MAG TPA: ATP-binding cassette domain-containing protein, partial [Planctomycetota bacterium]|nr:ATP-binding cassette domain-containing protein [Planctomycetota bacterium]